MGFLSEIFGAGSPKERELVNNYASQFETMGFPRATAKQTAKKLLSHAKQMMQWGVKGRSFPDQYVSDLAQIGKENQGLAEILIKKRGDGVRDEDIIWWWSLPALDRYMMLAMDNLHRIAAHDSAISSGLPEVEANKVVWKQHPCYGEPDEEHDTQVGEDRPIPFELIDRVNTYIKKRKETDAQKFENEMEQSTSFNALIRNEIRAGNL